MVPRGRVVAGPGEAVALSTGVGGAGEHKRPLIGTQLEQAVIRRARILQPDNVVNLRVRCGTGCEAGLLDAMDRVQRHRLPGAVEDRRLVHVAPESRNAILHKLAIKIAPPLARLRAREVWKDRRPGPHDPAKFASVGILYELVGSMTGVV